MDLHASFAEKFGSILSVSWLVTNVHNVISSGYNQSQPHISSSKPCSSSVWQTCILSVTFTTPNFTNIGIWCTRRRAVGNGGIKWPQRRWLQWGRRWWCRSDVGLRKAYCDLLGGGGRSTGEGWWFAGVDGEAEESWQMAYFRRGSGHWRGHRDWR